MTLHAIREKIKIKNCVQRHHYQLNNQHSQYNKYQQGMLRSLCLFQQTGVNDIEHNTIQ